LKQFEDLGYYCIDNIPLDLIEPLIDHALRTDDLRYRKLALGIDARGKPSEIANFQRYYDTLRPKGIDASVTFLIADSETLLRRYNETRRK
ncbi:RNase adapter RapZ, partial [Acinetobacter baumannii]